MKSSEIRERFLKYFEAKAHKILPGSSLVPADPTVLLTLAGMLQFKPIFLGLEHPKFKRVTTIQKCIRMNDIEHVGITSRHHTFFEMLGNFSFGDYFKKEAISFAWEFLTKELSLPVEKLLIAVYEKDEEAFNIWKDLICIPANRIHKLGEDNNFWAAGPTGPCGPCSEIYFDLGESRGCGKPGCAPGCDCDRFLEIWNLVFIQYNRDPNKHLIELPSKNIDTGMGLERIASVLQSVPTNFDTDLFAPILENLNSMAKISDGRAIESKRIIADHIRAIVHLLADMVIPSNEGRGYVLRRLIRRAVRHGKILGINEPFLFKLSNVVSEVNGSFYDEVKKESKYIAQTIKTEEEHFSRTLEQGMATLNKFIAGGAKIIPGNDAFVLHDTYGFPLELTREIALESGVNVDEAGFNKLMEQQKELGRTSGLSATSHHLTKKLGTLPHTKFTGYSILTSDAKIVHIDEEDNFILLDKTVFYPESGGQVGDMGKICWNGKEHEVIGAYGHVGGAIAHQLKSVKGFVLKDPVKLTVDHEKRKASSIHHTATHLLHATLRELFGKGVKQAGSHVAPDGFHFDFTHFGGISKDDIDRIERRVNELIKAKMKVELEELSLAEAQKRGALMFFGEKYGEKVRMIKIGDFSLELCGGTHVKNTSEISFFMISAENSISSGVRRIEAKAGEAAKQYIISMGIAEWEKNKQMFGKYEALELKKEFLEGKPETYYQFFRVMADDIPTLKNAVNQGNIFLANRIIEDYKKKNSGLHGRINELQEELESDNLKKFSSTLDAILKDAVQVNGIPVIKCEFKHYNSDILRKISDLIKGKVSSYVAALFSLEVGKVTLVISLSNDLAGEGLDAGTMVKEAAAILGGGGGGKKTIAEAGGHDTTKIKESFDRIVELVKEKT